jgi:hypothetical protein
MKTTLALASLWILVPPIASEVTLAWAPETGTVLHRTFEAHATLSLTGVSLLVDGEEVHAAEEVPDQGTDFTERIVVTDTLGDVEEGRPAELSRAFDELGQESSIHAEDQEVSSTETSDLEGAAVTFAWDPDAESYSVAAADGSEVDGELLERLVEDMDLRAILPDRDVERGDEWEIPVEAYLGWMWPGGHLAFHGEEDGEDVRSSANDFYDQVVGNLSGSGRGRFLEVREEEGRELAVLWVEFEVETHYETEVEADEENELPARTLRNEIQRKVEGEVLWDLEAGHASSAALEAEATLIQSESRTGFDPEGESVEIEQRMTFEGAYEYRLAVERKE